MRLFELSIGTLMARFYLMMALVIVGVLTQIWFITVLAFPVFLSIMMGASFGKPSGNETQTEMKATKNRTINHGKGVAA